MEILLPHSRSEYQISARDTSSCENGAFLLAEATVCCMQVLLWKWSRTLSNKYTKIFVQTIYNSALSDW